MYFQYGSRETEYLKSRDKALGEVIDRIGHRLSGNRSGSFLLCGPSHRGTADLNQGPGHYLGKNERTIRRSNPGDHRRGSGRPASVRRHSHFARCEYIRDFAAKVQSGALDLQEISRLPDDQAIKALAFLKGIGVWTAEMILLFCLQRPDILSFDDLAIQRGLRMVYHHRSIDRKRFEKYRRRFSPCGSVASLYLWAVAGGAIPEMKD